MKRPTLLKRLGVWGICLLSIWLALPNAFYARVDTHKTATENSSQGDWPGWLPDNLINLGLDLRGGAHLLAEVDVPGAIEQRLTALWPSLRDALREEGDNAVRIKKTAGTRWRTACCRVAGQLWRHRSPDCCRFCHPCRGAHWPNDARSGGD
ncbi:hypothetical protein [Roseovarius sp. PS-C2]|uniref:hypothetical protein n=1 Tax=Roseovarius sp. PS-C2 TaxID=2820814 RepID=UPI00209B0988|nr:hypothetical protein [Roseovarius sp. PS-C2]